MKKMNTIGLLDSLQTDTRQIILATNYLLQEDPETLLLKPAPEKWSVAQVIEHLNTYGRYYLPAIEHAIHADKHAPDPDYTPGWLGDYFTKSMKPRENGSIPNKMKTFPGHRPSADAESKPAIDEFLQQEQKLLDLLEKAKQANISKIRIPITLTKMVKLKLGDIFRFLVAHHQRHFVQIRNTLKAVGSAQPE